MFSNLIFIDEYGDPSKGGSSHFSILGVHVNTNHYHQRIRPTIELLRQKYLYSALAPLHDRQLRKGEYPYYAFKNATIRSSFYREFAELTSKLEYTLTLVIIVKETYAKKDYPITKQYRIALQFLLERVSLDLPKGSKKVMVVMEARGEKQDKDLRCVFSKKCLVGKSLISNEVFEPIFIKKNQLSAGLEMADLLLAAAARIELERRGKSKLGFNPPRVAEHDRYVYEKAIYPKYRADGSLGRAIKFFPEEEK